MQLSPKIKIALKFVIAGSLLAALISQIDMALTKTILLGANPWLCLAAFLILSSRKFVAAFRWKILLSPNLYKVSVLRLTILYFIGGFFSFFLPTVVGGDLVRGYYLYGDGIDKQEVVSSIIVERVLGITAMMLLALLAMSGGFNLIQSNVIKLIVIVPSVMGLTIVWLLYIWEPTQFFRSTAEASGKLVRTVVDIFHQVRSYKSLSVALLLGFVFSVLFQLLGIGATYLIALSLGSQTSFFYFLIFLPNVWLISMLPVSINGLGIREGTFVFFVYIRWNEWRNGHCYFNNYFISNGRLGSGRQYLFSFLSEKNHSNGRIFEKLLKFVLIIKLKI